MFKLRAFSCLTVATKFSVSNFTFFLVFNFKFCSFFVFKPLQWGIVLPRIQMLKIRSMNLQIRAFMWTIFIDIIVFLFLSKNFKLFFNITFNNIIHSLVLFFLVFIVFFFSNINMAFNSPKTKTSKDNTNIIFHSFYKVSVVHSENISIEVLNINSNHPNLLIIYKSTWSVIQSIVRQCQ